MNEKISGRFRMLVLFLAVMAILPLIGCPKSHPVGYKPAIKSNVIEHAPVGLKVQVQDFKWRYVRGGTGLEVNGTVRNKTGVTQSPVVLYVMLFDEDGLAVGMGDVRVSPRHLLNDEVGNFRLMVGAHRQSHPKPIKHIRILTNAQND